MTCIYVSSGTAPLVFGFKHREFAIARPGIMRRGSQAFNDIEQKTGLPLVELWCHVSRGVVLPEATSHGVPCPTQARVVGE